MATEKTNVTEWQDVLREASRGKHYPALYKRVNRLISMPSRKRGAVTLFKVSKYTKANDNVLVPRKILGTGKIDHKVSIAALEFSASAKEALQSAGCEIVSIKEMVKKDRIHLIV